MQGERQSLFPKITLKDNARIAIMKNGTVAAKWDWATYSSPPFICRVETTAGVRASAFRVDSHPEDWSLSTAGRPFIIWGQSLGSIRMEANPLTAMGEEIVYTSVVY